MAATGFFDGLADIAQHGFAPATPTFGHDPESAKTGQALQDSAAKHSAQSQSQQPATKSSSQKTGSTDSGNLYFTIGSKRVQGWLDCEIMRSIEAVPIMLNVRLNTNFPDSKPIIIHAGEPIIVQDDHDTLFTGWVDTVVTGFGQQGSYQTLGCSSKCEDIVVCCNLFSANMISASNVIDFATKLCQPFGVTVIDKTSGGLPAIPNIPLSMTDRVFDLIERIARFSGVLIYDDEKGQLVIANIGVERMSGTLTEGDNLLSASYTESLAQRFSDYRFVWQASGYVYGQAGAVPQSGYASDPVLKALGRVRPFVGVSNQADLGGTPIAQKRATWEANRRLGRGNMVHVSVVGWRDSKGNLWRPNARVTVMSPTLGITKREMIIADVNYSRGVDTGTTCEMTLYPPEAFSTEPVAVLDPIANLTVNGDVPSPSASTAGTDGRRDR